MKTIVLSLFTVALASALAVHAAPSVLDASLSTDRTQLNLHWTSLPGQMQRIQISSDLVHWTNLPPVLTSVSSNSTWADDGTLTGGLFGAQPRYYRLDQFSALNEIAGTTVTFLPAATGTSYIWDFGDGTTSTNATATHTFSEDGVYDVVLTLTDASGSHRGTNTIWSDTPANILLTPATLAAVREKAAANTPQWQAFKQQLDSQLNKVIGDGAYEADELTVIGDYALGYKALEFQDPVTAAKYADKAIGLINSALHDFQKVSEISLLYLARGDGSNKVFTLPNSNIVSSSLSAYTATTKVITVKRGSGPTDAVEYYDTFIKVSDTSDGTADYQQNTDWRRSGDLANNLIDWSIAAPGHKPVTGSNYYVTVASSLSISGASASLSGSTMTLSKAPATNKAIYVQYVYGSHAPDFSTLAFQQTSAGDGGFNSVTIDDGYTYRYLGKFTALGYDWLFGYPGMTAALKAQIATMLVRWSDYWKTNGYRADDPASNYAEGGYVSRMFTALGIVGRDTNSARLLSQISSYRQTNVVPLLTNTTESYYGGFWAEGWNYGPQAARNLILSALAYQTAGLGNITPEQAWAGQVIDSLISEQASQNLIYDGGDWYTYPAPFVEKDLLYLTAAVATNSVSRSNANYIIQTYSGNQTADMQDLIFRDPNAGAAFWPNAPLDRYAQGTGLITGRADWSYHSTWLAFQLGNLIETDHQSYNQGNLEIQRGTDALLINANEVGENQEVNTESSYGNLIAIDDNGAGTQNYRFNEGFWFGEPGCRITSYESAPDHLYAAGDYTAAYSLNTTPGTGTATKLTRQFVYIRPDYIVVHDRATTKAANDPKQLRWHFLSNPTVQTNANAWLAASGSSKLFGQTFSRSGLITSNTSVVCPPDGDAVVYRIVTQNTNNAMNVTYVTALQSAPSTTSNMVATMSVLSGDGRMEGVQMGTNVVLFGSDAALNPFTNSIAYSVNATGTVNHIIADLPPGRSFPVTVDGVALGTFFSSAQGTLSFSTIASGPQSILLQ